MNRLLGKLASGSNMQGVAQNRRVLNAREDSSTGTTVKVAAEVEFPKKSDVKKSRIIYSTPIYKLIPSMMTLLALCIGFTSIRYALDEKWLIASSLVIFAAVLDGLDGRIARLLDATSKFGAELDSLSDIVNFGVAPALITYWWSLSGIPFKGVGWAAVLFFIACSAIRLARFNADDKDDVVALKADTFSGVPMPAGGLLLLMPMMMTFELLDCEISYWFIFVYTIMIATLMASKIPTFSLKSFHVKNDYIYVILISCAFVIVCVILEPWIILPCFLLCYIIFIPIFYFYKKRNV